MHPAKPHESSVVTRRLAVMVAGLAAVAAGCSSDIDDSDFEAVGTNQVEFDHFERTVFREADTGIYIVNGDTPVVDIKHLREFWETHVRDGALIVNQSGGRDMIWTAEQRRNLTYCVSTDFGSRYESVVTAMADATRAWEEVADVDFVHVDSLDSNCTSSTSEVVFDVNPVNAGGQYLARAFFPGQSRYSRNVLIDRTAHNSSQPSLTGILRHELGHTLGFRHEHTRPEAGACFEDNNWRALTEYDGASVMHYPQCNGTGDRTLNLTAKDIAGVQALYGAPSGGGGGGGDGGSGGDDGGGDGGDGAPVTETFSGRLARGAFEAVGPEEGFEVVPGTTFKVVMTGTGDADLYVKFGSAPTGRSFHCRPYLSDARETCTLDVPEGETRAFVKVHAYTAATFEIEVGYTAPGSGGGGGTETSTSYEGTVARREAASHGPIPVVPGTPFKVVMAGTGDPDLYVRFGAAPTLSEFDCRPYLDGADESCSLTVPSDASEAHLLVHGYSESSYTIDVNYTTP